MLFLNPESLACCPRLLGHPECALLWHEVQGRSVLWQSPRDCQVSSSILGLAVDCTVWAFEAFSSYLLLLFRSWKIFWQTTEAEVFSHTFCTFKGVLNVFWTASATVKGACCLQIYRTYTARAYSSSIFLRVGILLQLMSLGHNLQQCDCKPALINVSATQLSSGKNIVSR